MAYQYKVVPFIGQSRGRLSPDEVATQLESIISQYTALGWEFYQLSDVNIEVQPGCLAGLLGAKTQYARFDQLIFRVEQGAHIRSTSADSSWRVAKTTQDEEQISSKARSADRERRRSVPVTSKHLAVWREKSDEQIRDAMAAIHEYTQEGRQVILAEFETRALEPVSEAERVALQTFRRLRQSHAAAEKVTSSNIENDPAEQDHLSYCYHCGADLAADSKICAECGKSLQ